MDTHDAHDTQVQAELERRTTIITRDEAGDPAHAALSGTDLAWLVGIVLAAVVCGLLAST